MHRNKILRIEKKELPKIPEKKELESLIISETISYSYLHS